MRVCSFDTGPPSVSIFELSGMFVSTPLIQSYDFVIIAQEDGFFIEFDKAVFMVRAGTAGFSIESCS
jgi:hypothetical protein